MAERGLKLLILSKKLARKLMVLEQIMQEWAGDEPNYKALADYVENELDNKLKNEGIFARVYSRVKKPESIVKKLYKKGLSIDNYRAINDKAGVRAICRFKDERERIADYIRRDFCVVREENKSSLLEIDQIGYKSHHFDVSVRDDVGISLPSIKGLICEIQVRTLCEDTWAEINHNLGYKGYATLQPEIRRRLFCLGGLLEVADDCFTDINYKITVTTKLDENSASNVLESYGVKILKQEFDKEFTVATLKTLVPLFGEIRVTEFESMIKKFVDKNSERISFIIKERKGEVSTFPFLSQPELIVIFLLIDTEPFKLKEVWERSFPIRDLEKLSTWWGKPIHDLVQE